MVFSDFQHSIPNSHLIMDNILIGSEKQIEWANIIRSEAIESLDATLAGASNVYADAARIVGSGSVSNSDPLPFGGEVCSQG